MLVFALDKIVKFDNHYLNLKKKNMDEENFPKQGGEAL